MPSESSVKKPSAAAGSGAGSPRQSSAASAAAVGSALPKRKTASAASSSETPAVAAGLRRRESSEGSAPQDRGTPSRESTSPQGLQAQLAEAPSSASPLRSFRTSGSGQSPEKANGSKPNSPEKASSSKPNSPEKAAASSGEQQVSAASSGSAGLAFSPPDRASLGADAPGAEFQESRRERLGSSPLGSSLSPLASGLGLGERRVPSPRDRISSIFTDRSCSSPHQLAFYTSGASSSESAGPLLEHSPAARSNKAPSDSPPSEFSP
ncbi:unnamed protein product, partial [Polarella glacialis]